MSVHLSLQITKRIPVVHLVLPLKDTATNRTYRRAVPIALDRYRSKSRHLLMLV